MATASAVAADKGSSLTLPRGDAARPCTVAASRLPEGIRAGRMKGDPPLIAPPAIPAAERPS
jgi:hypothetical protein